MDDIAHEATYPHPPEAVWRALTTREAIRAWLMETTFETPTVGHRFRFVDKPRRALGWDGVTECEVLEAEPPRRLVVRFGDGAGGFPVTFLRWELEPTGEGTRVRFRHDGFTGFKGWMMRQGMNRGWGGILRHAVPFVLDRMRSGGFPSREETRAAARRGYRTEHAARRAQP